MRQIGKLRKAKFLKDFAAILAKYGAVSHPEHLSRDGQDANYSLETKAGTLTIHVDIDAIFTLFCRFANPTLAAEVAGFELWPRKNPMDRLIYKKTDHRLNPYSGKWNFHYRDEEWTLTQFDQELAAFATPEQMGVIYGKRRGRVTDQVEKETV